MNIDAAQLRLYGVTGPHTQKEDVIAAILGGVSCIQLREKGGASYEKAVEIRDVCRAHGVPFIVNDDPRFALLCDADGVHVGQEDMSPAEVRRILGENKIIGVTAHSVEEAIAAAEGGADYLGAGAVFPSPTKGNTIPLSYETLTAIVKSVSIPVVAIGGITLENIGRLRHSGIAGVAVVSAVFGAADKTLAAKRLREAVL